MRRNVISWLTAQAPAARHALVLSHNISFLFVQGVLGSRLHAAGNPRLTIFADAGCATSAWREDRALLDGLGVRYRVVPVDLGPWRRFHPKAVLLASPDRAALAIGSGNLTWGGMAANHEAWTFAVSDGEGAPLIAAFRDYMRTLVPRLPLPEPLRDAVDAIFDPGQTWVADLPAPSGLAGSPSPTPLLDQIVGRVTGNVRSVTVLAPYYDDDGAALADIARRYPVPVTCWMQTGREGLARDAAAGLPPNVMLRSVEVPEERRPSFIHAKVLAFHRDEDVVLAVGSANCSRAALLAGEDRSNAELMALEAVSHERFEALLAELVRSPAAPVLPERPPSEDWPEPETPVLRILAARQAAGVLEVAFRPAEPLASLSVQALEGAWPAEAEWEQGVARAAVSVRLRAVRIVGVTLAGMEIASDEVWVDDEVSLAAPATLRRMFNRMLDMGSPQTDPAEAFRGVLEIFRDYLRDPEASRRRMRRREHGEGSPRPYDPAAVFADDFGSLGVPALRNTYGRREPVSILAILEALFSVSREVGATPQPPLPLSDEEGEGDGDGEDGARSGSPPDLLSPPLKWVLDKRAKAQLRRALAAVESALMDEAFVAARSPELLGADLALAAILLVKGLSDRLLDPQDYREATRRLWTTLFFGENGVPGRVPARIAALTGAGQRIAFVAAIASPRLSAALTLWCMTEWAAGDAECLAFRLSAARLQLVQPWLFAGAPPDVLATEVASQAEILLPSNDQAMAARTWVELVRAGEALRILAVALESRSAQELWNMAEAGWLDPSDVVWVHGRFAIPLRRMRREGGVNIEVRFMGESMTHKYKGDHIVPIRELVERNVLDLPPAACRQVLSLISAAREIHVPIPA